MPKIVAVGALAPALTLAAGSPSAFAQAPASNRAAPTSATLGDRMVTINAACTPGIDGKVGSIEAGKFAGFVVLGDDPASVESLAIRDIPVLATISGGRVISASDTRHPR
jgi:predicted amidohydrolase YtcJ